MAKRSNSLNLKFIRSRKRKLHTSKDLSNKPYESQGVSIIKVMGNVFFFYIIIIIMMAMHVCFSRCLGLTRILRKIWKVFLCWITQR